MYDRNRILVRIRSFRAVQEDLEPTQVRIKVLVVVRRRRILFGDQVPLEKQEEEGRDRQEHDRSPERLQSRGPHGLRLREGLHEQQH